MFDYVALAQSRLTGFFAEKPLIKALTEAMVGPLTSIEATADSLKNDRWIATAIGKQLDGCGYIVGEKRQGRNDDDYREAILFRVFVNTSNAVSEDLIHALRYLTKPDDLQYIEQYPITAMLFTDGAVISPNIHAVMQDLAPAAISELPIMVSFARKSPFRFGKESAPSELFVNANADYLTAGGSDLQLTSTAAVTDSRLGGIAAADFFVGDFYLDVGFDSFAINNPETDKIITGGSNLVGVYQ